MWEQAKEASTDFAKRHGMKPRTTKLFRATAEHLTAKCDGGPDTATNIVAACIWCNQRRHAQPKPPASDLYLSKVQRRMKAGRWRSLHLATPSAPPTQAGHLTS